MVQAAHGTHGVLPIRLDNDPRRDMTDRSIVNAIGKLESASVPILNQPVGHTSPRFTHFSNKKDKTFNAEIPIRV